MPGRNARIDLTDRKYRFKWEIGQSRGVFGQVGAVDIDATSGQVLADSQATQEISIHARNLARSAALSAE